MYDVAIVGAGPAGTTAALQLARAGLKVALLEKEPLPRYKTCGGGLVPRALGLLPSDAARVVERWADRAELHLLDADLHFAAARNPPILALTMRDRLDFLLTSCAGASGAEIMAPRRVTGVAPEGQRVRLDTDRGPLVARFAIAADGAASEVARRAGWRDGRHLIPALEYEITVPEAAWIRHAAVPRFDVGIVPHGYAWVFPKAAHLSVGLLSTRRGAVDLPGRLAAYLRTLGIEPRTVVRHGFVIPVRPRAGPLVQGRVLLVGDAAGFADPLTAEGISFAAASGRIAADVVAGCDLDEARIRAAYHAALRPGILAELRIARALARLLYDHPRVRNAIFRRVGQRVVDAIADVFAGTRTYRGSVTGLLRPLRLVPSTRS